MALKNAGNGTGDSIQCMPITTTPRLGAAGSIDVSDAKVIKFDADCDGLQMNPGTTADASDYHVLSASEAYAIGDGVTNIYVNGSCGYILD